MNTELTRSRVRHSHLAAIALIWVLAGCRSETGSFNAAAAEKVATEKGLRPGGPAAKNSGKLVGRGSQSTKTGFDLLPKP